MICFAITLCCGVPAFGVELPDPTKPGAADPRRKRFEPPPVIAPDFVPRPIKKDKPKETGIQARVQVIKIELVGVVDRPEMDISVAELSAFVEQLRTQKIQEERKKILDLQRLKSQENSSSLLKKIEKIARDAELEKDREILEETIEQFRAREDLDESLSLLQLQEIAGSVAQYYRDRGFILVQAFIPPQTISDGIVKIRVLEGILGHVTVEKMERFTEKQLLEPFQELAGQPVTADGIEEAMLLLNDYPGLKTFAVFRPGIFTGETDLLVSVVEEEFREATLHGDNYGSIYTGEFRARYDFFVNNPFRLNDRIIASVSQSINPENGLYLGMVYEKRAFGARNLFSFNLSNNDYSLGDDLAAFGISGENMQAGVSWRHALKRGRLFNTYSLLDFNVKSSRLNIVQGNDKKDDLSVLGGEVGFNWSDLENKNSSSGRFKISQGFSGVFNSLEASSSPSGITSSRRGGSGNFASGDFTKFSGDFNFWTRLQADQLLHLSLQAQQSSDLLTSLEQMPIGGPGSVRAYSTSEYLRDTAFSTSLEWIVKAPGFADEHAFDNQRWGEILDTVLFIDYAKGWLNDPLASELEEVDLTGIGAGLRFNYKNLFARFEIATPVGGEAASNNRDPQYYLELNYEF